LFILEHSKLTKVLDATPKTAMVVVMKARGKPYSETDFRTIFHKYRGTMLKAGKSAPV